MDDNRKAILLGGVVTAVSAIGVFLLPTMFGLTGGRTEGSLFFKLPLLGGITGGLVGGYLATDGSGNTTRESSMKSGLYAAIFGLVLVMIAYILYSTTVSRGTSPPPTFVIIVTSLIFSIPLFIAYLVEGLLFGVLGGTIRNLRSEGT